MKSLSANIPLEGKTALVRVDYNVPITGTSITDARRISASYQTIDFLLKKKARVVLIAHLGSGSASLQPVAQFLKKRYKVYLYTDDVELRKTKDDLARIPADTVVILENIRRYKGEEKNSAIFAKALARLGDVYINDAFSVSHRAHASVVGIPKLLPAYAGFQLEKEVQTLSKVMLRPTHPFLFILGGAKFGTKIPLIKRFSRIANEVVITGAILNSFYKASGFEVGKSVVDDGYDIEIKKILNSGSVLLPIDVLVSRGAKTIPVAPYEVQKGDVIVDIGPQSTALIAEKIKKARMIVWNGPTGWYEKGYTKATIDIARAIGTSKATAVIGGGDTGAVIEKVVKGKKNIFVSTGGGATLDFLANGSLPGIDVLG